MWAVAFAAVVSFMGLGLVDPILPAIAHDLHATPSDVELLFTIYFAFTGLSMLFSSVVASRIGAKRTLLAGLVLIVIFSALAGMSNSVGAIVGLRAGTARCRAPRDRAVGDRRGGQRRRRRRRDDL